MGRVAAWDVGHDWMLASLLRWRLRRSVMFPVAVPISLRFLSGVRVRAQVSHALFRVQSLFELTNSKPTKLAL